MLSLSHRNKDDTLYRDRFRKSYKLKVWPGWKRHSGAVATYAWKLKPKTTISVSLRDDKTYKFDTIVRLFNEQLNQAAGGDPIANLSYKDGKVNLYVKDNTQLSNLKISDDIAKELKIKGNISNSGEPVDIDKIAFNNTKNVFLACDQIDSMVTAAVCVDDPVSFEKPMPTACFHNNYHQHLTFHIKDDQGNNLPIQRVFCRLLINK